MANQNNSQKIVERCYLNILRRKPDEAGLKHYTKLLENNEKDNFEKIEEYQKRNCIHLDLLLSNLD